MTAALERLSLNQKTTNSWTLPEAVAGCVRAEGLCFSSMSVCLMSETRRASVRQYCLSFGAGLNSVSTPLDSSSP